MTSSRAIWDLGELPFHVGVLPHPVHDAFPRRLPFRVGFSDALHLFTQVYNPQVMEMLRDVYARGSQLGIPMGDEGLGKAYAADFQSAIEGWLADDLSRTTLLEVGCGSGHLLRALAESGAEVSGVEPDPRCAGIMEQHGIPVATCNFEDFRPDTAFDCIVHYCVLEHAVDPLAFLRRQRRLLAPGGRVICAVPDCGDALDAGDISMFIHQHWSYFSAASLRRVATAAGLRVEGEQRAAVGALLYFSLRAPAGDQASEEGVPPGRGAAASPPAGEAVDPATFVARGRQALRRVDGWVRDAHRGNRSLGIYCPVRAINYVPEGSEAWDAVRLFDDAPALRGKYLPPFTRAIEGGDGLEREAVDEVLIMSRPFGAAIEAAIRARPLRAQPRIVHIEDLLAHD